MNVNRPRSAAHRLAALVGRYSETRGVAVIVRDKELSLSVVAIHYLRNGVPQLRKTLSQPLIHESTSINASSALLEQTGAEPRHCHCPCATARNLPLDCTQKWCGSGPCPCSGTGRESSHRRLSRGQSPVDRRSQPPCCPSTGTRTRQCADPGRRGRQPHRPACRWLNARGRLHAFERTRARASIRTSHHGWLPDARWCPAAPNDRRAG